MAEIFRIWFKTTYFVINFELLSITKYFIISASFFITIIKVMSYFDSKRKLYSMSLLVTGNVIRMNLIMNIAEATK